MKLIIDIPYESYYTFKCDLEKGNSNLNALGEIIANGIPYEEMDRLNERGVYEVRIADRGEEE